MMGNRPLLMAPGVVSRLRKGGFADPFATQGTGLLMTPAETLRGLRLALALEEEAIAVYEALAEAAADDRAAAVLRSIASEERVHVGELQRAIEALSPDEAVHLDNGRDEAEALMAREDPPEAGL